MATVFFSLNGKSAASRITFENPACQWRDLPQKTSYNSSKTRESVAFALGTILKKGLRQEVIEMMRLLKLLFVLAVLVGAAVLGYAYIGDLSPEQSDVSAPVELNGN